jgi:hypothetical protein
VFFVVWHRFVFLPQTDPGNLPDKVPHTCRRLHLKRFHSGVNTVTPNFENLTDNHLRWQCPWIRKIIYPTELICITNYIQLLQIDLPVA